MSKKHKKHKKKHKHRRESNEPADHAVSSPKTSIKLKLKIGGETMATKKWVLCFSSIENYRKLCVEKRDKIVYVIDINERNDNVLVFYLFRYV